MGTVSLDTDLDRQRAAARVSRWLQWVIASFVLVVLIGLGVLAILEIPYAHPASVKEIAAALQRHPQPAFRLCLETHTSPKGLVWQSTVRNCEIDLALHAFPIDTLRHRQQALILGVRSPTKHAP